MGACSARGSETSYGDGFGGTVNETACCAAATAATTEAANPQRLIYGHVCMSTVHVSIVLETPSAPTRAVDFFRCRVP